ncbi:hypothetical protein [Streptosporangium lutulentum]|uniref:Uncharacterized protein n=1 Tax=Streptosporangium lutulentum TaxID=1461250 RepID=A0ABT9QUG8_9ACTN|nr:hypothetical protein [Streptosporangium lutulentum]MDP9850407.1 hypothetical protein [Streptosporangium lutulentum]
MNTERRLIGKDKLDAFIAARGPRYAVVSRSGDHYCGVYADTEIEASAEREHHIGCGRELPPVSIYGPDDDLPELPTFGRFRTAAIRAEREATSLLRARVHRRAEEMQEKEGTVNESALTREAGVDRMTIRGWLGK